MVIQSAMEHATQGRIEVALRSLRGALDGSANDAPVLLALGQVLWFAGDQAGAIEALQRAAAGEAKGSRARLELARALWSMGRSEAAAREYEEIVARQPRVIEGWNELAGVWVRAGEFDKAWGVFRRAAGAMPGETTPWLSWTHTMVRTGEVEAGVRVAREAASAFPESTEIIENLCLTLAFADGAGAQELVDLHARLGGLMAQGSRRPAAVFTNSRDPNRPLKVAFWSTDFRFHACAFFLAGLLTRLDRSRVQVFCYALNAPDSVSRAFAGLGVYRELQRVPEEEIARVARADGIDVLVDCSGWSMGHRMDVLVPRLAPVQVEYLGYSNTSGLPTMDYRIVDAITDPPGSEAFATERLLKLPRCFVCFAMPDHTPPEALSPWLGAFAASGRVQPGVTFGCFNRLEKVQGRVLRCWATLLERVPGATLLLKDGPPGSRLSLERRFAGAGGDGSRLRWTGFEADPSRHLAAYHQVDIALDPFAYNGTTTTCESLLMGVPVVGLMGDQHRSRVGASLLTNVGLPELIAKSEDEYVSLAAGLATDLPRLLRLHQNVRRQMLASPICNATQYAQDFEAALRGAWRGWCVGGAG